MDNLNVQLIVKKGNSYIFKAQNSFCVFNNFFVVLLDTNQMLISSEIFKNHV